MTADLPPSPRPNYYIDSNIFFYAKINDAVYGESCSKILREIASSRLLVATSALVLIEVANAMKKYGLRDIGDEVNALCSLGMEMYSFDSSDVQEAAEVYEKAKISPYDCLHAAIMRRNELEKIISADKEFDKVEWIKRQDPLRLAIP